MAAEVVVRAPTEADAAAVADVCNELSGTLYGVADLSPEEVRYWLSLPELGTVVAERDGAVAGYADFRRRGSGSIEIDLRVRPAAAGLGVADALLGAAEAFAPGTTGRCLVSERDDEGRSALGRRGYRLIRHSFYMQIELSEPPESPVWPPGFAVRRYAGPADERPVYACQQESFRDHWEFRPAPFEEWRRYSFGRPTFDPSLWWLAESGDELAGICLNDWHATGDRTFGWIGTLGVRKPWRGRGLGLALLRHSFVDFARLGATRVGLTVDGENTTGAVRLYERAGMRQVRRVDIYERTL